MIRLSNLADDFYEYDEVNQWIIGRRTHKKYQLGDQVQVIVKGADTIKRQVDLDLVGNAAVVRVQKAMRRQEKSKGKARRSDKKSGGKKRRR
jgi:ribosomal protein L14